jgi:3-oxoacyl-[acyl-carrier protein] reductase
MSSEPSTPSGASMSSEPSTPSGAATWSGSSTSSGSSVPAESSARPVALVTGVGRRAGIAAAIATRLAQDGWDVATSYWAPYDERMPWGHPTGDVEQIGTELREAGARTLAVADDLVQVEAPRRIFDAVRAELGPVTALVMCHAESVDSGLLDTTVESFDRHFAVNARATWLLIREFARQYGSEQQSGSDQQFANEPGPGRLIALTSDHTVFNLPYGASKGALDRIVLAAARELAHLQLTANVINPGPVDTGWINDELRESIGKQSPFGRVGRPGDTAALVSFLCSADGGWINGQIVYSDGGLHA